MSDEPLLTLRQVAEKLGLPESTARYYRDAFLQHIPSVGTGRRRRYPPPAVAVLRSVAAGYAAGKTHEAIEASLDGATPSAAALPHEPAPGARPGAGDVTNLEILAAIVDGEREQREALWQMAKEIVRLTDVLESQEKVLGEIAEHAGVQPALARAAEPRAIGAGGVPTATVGASPPPEPPPGPRMPFVTVEPVAAPVQPAAPAPAAPAPAPPARAAAAAPATPPAPEPAAAPEPLFTAPPPAVAAGSDMERLRTELERERDLVERLREAKVKLEHRVTDAESELDEQRRRRRGSVLGRILGPEPKEREGR